MRGVTPCVPREALSVSFQLTRLMRGVTQEQKLLQSIIDISTHTPHARRDQKEWKLSLSIR